MARETANEPPVFATSGSEATLADVGRAIRRNAKWVATAGLTAFVAAVAFVLLVTPRYTGEARLLLQTGESSFTRPGGERERIEQAPQIDEQAVASQVQVVMSRDLALKVIQKLGLVGNSEFDPQSEGPGLLRQIATMLGLAKDLSLSPPEERVLERYYDHLLVYPVGKSRIVAIEFRSRDAELAARGANTIAEIYLDLQEDAKKDQARSASTWLGTNIEGLRARLAESEAKVEAFRSKTGLISGSGTGTLSAQQLSELSGQLAQARTAQSDAQVKAKLIRDLIKDGRAFDIPDVANNELIRRLLEQRVTMKAQLALELRTLMPAHPRIKELNAQLGDLETQIRTAADRTVRTLENDSRIAGGRVDSLVAAVEGQKKIVSTANEGEVQLRALEREARIQREQLEGYLGRYRDASARDSSYGVPPDARIVSRAIIPQLPSFPKKLPIVGLSTLAALVLAMGAIVVKELLTAGAPVMHGPVTYAMPERDLRERDLHERGFAERFRPGYDETAREPDLTFDLAHLRPPQQSLAEPVPVEPAAEPETVASAEAAPTARYDFGHLVSRLTRTDPGDRGRRVLVRSLESRSAGFDVAQGLALSLADQSRVILITVDGDEDSPVDDVAGLTDLVTGEAKFSQVIRRSPGSPLHTVTPGTLVNEALTGNPDGVEIALSAFAETYDWVICALVGGELEELVKVFAPQVDTMVIASSLDPANVVLVRAYQDARAAGADDLLVARERVERSEAA